MQASEPKGGYTELIDESSNEIKEQSGEQLSGRKKQKGASDRELLEENLTVEAQLFKNPKLAVKIFEYMGGGGKYQGAVIAAAVFAHFCIGFTVGLLSISATAPTTTCSKEASPHQFLPCPESEACSLIKSGRGKVEFEYPTWTERYGMYCDNQLKRNFYKSLFILMMTFLVFFALQCADYIGRRVCFYITFILCGGGAVLCHFVDNFGWKVVMLGAANAAYIIYAGLFTFYLSECTSPKSFLFRNIVAGWKIAEPLGYLAFCLITIFTKNPDVLSFITMVAIVIALGVPCLFCVESPQFLLENYQIDKMLAVIDHIRKFNSKPENNDLKIEIYHDATIWVAEERAKSQTRAKPISPLWRVLTNKLYLYQVVALSSILFLLENLYFGVAMNLNSMGTSSTSLNGILVALVQLLSSILVILNSKNMSRRRWLLILQSSLIFCGIFLVLVTYMAESLTKKLIIAILSIVLVSGLINAAATPFYHYNSELFPVELRGTGNCLVNVIANTLSMSTPFLTMTSSGLGLHPLVGCCVVAVISTPLTYFLRNTV